MKPRQATPHPEMTEKTKNMDKSKVFLTAVISCSLLAVASLAQDTNAYVAVPATKLGVLEMNTGTVIVKGIAPAGSISVDGGVVNVACKEDTDIGAGRREYGITISVKTSNQFEDKTMVDYDELDSMLNAIDYLSKVDWYVTSLSSFNAYYTTKDGFRIAAIGRKRLSTIEFSLRSPRMSKGTVMSASQLAQFRVVIEQAKKTLDSIRPSK